jgi:hypothetical protein
MNDSADIGCAFSEWQKGCSCPVIPAVDHGSLLWLGGPGKKITVLENLYITSISTSTAPCTVHKRAQEIQRYTEDAQESQLDRRSLK